MASEQEKFDKIERAERLKTARQRAGIKGPKGVFDASGGTIDINNYKGHESGRNGFSVSDGIRYAELFGVPLAWLYLGIGKPEDFELPPSATTEIRNAFARVVNNPDSHRQVLTFIEFLLGPTADVSQSQPDQKHDQQARPSHRHAKEPS